MGESGDLGAIQLYKADNNAQYTSPMIQNELIGIIGKKVLESIVAEINEGMAITLLCDETPTHKREYLSICVRHVKEQIKVCKNY